MRKKQLFNTFQSKLSRCALRVGLKYFSHLMVRRPCNLSWQTLSRRNYHPKCRKWKMMLQINSKRSNYFLNRLTLFAKFIINQQRRLPSKNHPKMPMWYRVKRRPSDASWVGPVMMTSGGFSTGIFLLKTWISTPSVTGNSWWEASPCQTWECTSASFRRQRATFKQLPGWSWAVSRGGQSVVGGS